MSWVLTLGGLRELGTVFGGGDGRSCDEVKVWDGRGGEGEDAVLYDVAVLVAT